MQIKRTIAVLLALCFLLSVTVAAVSADPLRMGSEHDKKKEEKRSDKDDKKIEKEVVKTLKVVKKQDGLWVLQLIKVTEESHHFKKVWFTTEWKFIPFHKDHDQR